MYKVVTDTNVIISAILSPEGTPAQTMNFVFNEYVQIFYNQTIIEEYEEVLAREKFALSIERQRFFINKLHGSGILFNPLTSNLPLIDEDDRVFYDTAFQSGAMLITGNIKHYPPEAFIMTPAQFMGFVKSSEKTD